MKKRKTPPAQNPEHARGLYPEQLPPPTVKQIRLVANGMVEIDREGIARPLTMTLETAKHWHKIYETLALEFENAAPWEDYYYQIIAAMKYARCANCGGAIEYRGEHWRHLADDSTDGASFTKDMQICGKASPWKE